MASQSFLKSALRDVLIKIYSVVNAKNIFGNFSKTAAVDWFEFNSLAYIKANNIFPCLDQSKEVELGVSSTLKKN